MRSGAACGRYSRYDFDRNVNVERSGLLERTIRGREHHLRLEPRTLQSATAWIDEQRRFWTASFDRLDGVLAASKGKESQP